ncbi:hypothetical protein O181_070414 [Austropuccinia psidii MF-1]|uniref:Uncharacterized protein n=1 Tax=Austropuccinia psidii MF-1 TaxID=1389203 RepID=A0A9Q3F0S1_9BASI|nr:hypothetical protein [Austropuccinia psidii MF-1]
MIQNLKSQQDFKTVNHPITMQKILPKTGKRYLQGRKKKEKTKKVMNLTDSVGNGCGDNSYSEPNPHEEYLVEFKNHGTEEIGSVHSKRRKPMTKHLDGLKHKPPDKEGMTTGNLLAQGHMNHTDTSKKTGKSH